MEDENSTLKLPITIAMMDGRKFEGDLIVQLGGQVERTLNSEAKFILFADEQGPRYIAKAGILEVSPRKAERRMAA